MMELTLAELAKLFPDNTLVTDEACLIAGINSDSRKVDKGEVYVAIRGDNFDGHDFVQSSFEKGAIAALVDKRVTGKNLFYTDDVIGALGKIANYYRKKFSAPLIAITGSNGKTTTKEFLQHVLSLSGKVVATKGNLNNHIGVPLTIFCFDSLTQFFIVEMGMNHLSEIAYLTQMANPDLALVTSVGRAHLEGVGGTLEDVAKAKGELFAGLNKNATALVFGDDPYISQMPTAAFRVTYGFGAGNDYHVSHIEVKGGKTIFQLHHAGKTLRVVINMVGQQHVQNAVAVFAVAAHLQIPPEVIVRGIESFQIDFNRGRHIELIGHTFIDDTYNANPESMQAALEAFKQEYAGCRRIAVLGGMRELGGETQALHREIGEYCRGRADSVFAYGEFADAYLTGFGYSTSEERAHYFTDHAQLAEALKATLQAHSDAVVLVKGSRFMAMEKVLDFIKN